MGVAWWGPLFGNDWDRARVSFYGMVTRSCLLHIPASSSSSPSSWIILPTPGRLDYCCGDTMNRSDGGRRSVVGGPWRFDCNYKNSFRSTLGWWLRWLHHRWYCHWSMVVAAVAFTAGVVVIVGFVIWAKVVTRGLSRRISLEWELS